ncbi:selenocysteine-specific translation elongation factor [Metabacillus herbersteinensis]|uniref:Selenocysteine-specific elongation factor n=1 Tax=Metabacillus herbersteinensis TaxID=283816 RepID=A0ABV6GK55_9BACI
MKRFFTIGMAGHIDHGKTSLTKALTHINTDTLKEEIERKITIEPGIAPLNLKDDWDVSIVDVPGHERFIRQMIAGVAGIDLVILVVAADEGVMPQTKEHLEILSFLGIKNGIVAVSKIDRVDEEMRDLVKEEIVDELQDSIFEHSPVLFIDSLSGNGLDTLKSILTERLEKVIDKERIGDFRLPIDQVFVLKGHGAVVRGTVYEGSLRYTEEALILPQNKKIKIRQMQVHNHAVSEIGAGQRAAINLSGISLSEMKRGNVLVTGTSTITTNILDIVFKTIDNLNHCIKQRARVKLHIGTAEVYGKIIFFDRNEIANGKDEILCQLRLDEPVITKRGDRYVLRRPTPAETIGGGWVIDPKGENYLFGTKTIENLRSKKDGSPYERLCDFLLREKIREIEEICKHLAIQEDLFQQLVKKHTDIVVVKEKWVTLQLVVKQLSELLKSHLSQYHQTHPLRKGLNKKELKDAILFYCTDELLEYTLTHSEHKSTFLKREQYVYLSSFKPHFPSTWRKKMEQLLSILSADQLSVKSWREYYEKVGIPAAIATELKQFLLENEFAFTLDEKSIVSKEAYELAVHQLKEGTEENFTIKDAKELLKVSRKHLVPFLELLDKTNQTVRLKDIRKWKSVS